MGKRNNLICIKNNVVCDSYIQISKRVLTKDVCSHRHSFFELEFLVNGKLIQTINGKSFQFEPGDCTILSPGDYHSLEIISPVEILNLSFTEAILSYEQLKMIIIDKAFLFFHFTKSHMEIVEELFQLCLKESQMANEDLSCLKMMVQCLLNKVMTCAELCKGYSAKSRIDSPLQNAVFYLHSHFRDSPSLSQIAKIAHYNNSYFSAVFHSEFGMPYSEYLARIKIDYAKQLLLSSDLEIKKIAQQSGFSSESAFLKTFKKITGTTPSKFRISN